MNKQELTAKYKSLTDSERELLKHMIISFEDEEHYDIIEGLE